MQIEEIQQYLNDHEWDGWLLADFHGRNDIAMTLWNIGSMLTRRAFYFIPAVGTPTALVNPVEADKFADLPGDIVAYKGYAGLEKELARLLTPCNRIAMEYSEKGRLPYIGLVDAGTIELIRSFNVELVTSADLVAHFQARLSAEQIATHRVAANNLIEIMQAAHGHIAEELTQRRTLTEYDVVQFITRKFEEYDMVAEDGPNCSVEANAGNPHYEPAAEDSREIRKGQLILIDMWAKIKTDMAAYADITWMAYAGTKAEIPEEYAKIFATLHDARNAAVDFLRQHIGSRPVFGAEVDDACRAVIEKAGYGEFFTHRTGHSITTSVHGPGPNIDNLETEDRRKLQKGHLFSIEPGIYKKDFGFRLELDCLISHEGVEVTTLPLQTEIAPLF
ncbi:MAG: aminopeptidase P family protein [bacterium]|nr:aminopeptidase P family protein [bacterium]